MYMHVLHGRASGQYTLMDVGKTGMIILDLVVDHAKRRS